MVDAPRLFSFSSFVSRVGDTRAALGRMRTLIRKEYATPVVRETAVSIVRSCITNVECQAAQIRSWLKSYTEFCRDPSAIELVQSPTDMLRIVSNVGSVMGDCDDVAVLAAALGMAVGLRARIVATGRVGRFEHVYVDLGSPNEDHWFEMDITRPNQDVPAELRVNRMELVV